MSEEAPSGLKQQLMGTGFEDEPPCNVCGAANGVEHDGEKHEEHLRQLNAQAEQEAAQAAVGVPPSEEGQVADVSIPPWVPPLFQRVNFLVAVAQQQQQVNQMVVNQLAFTHRVMGQMFNAMVGKRPNLTEEEWKLLGISDPFGIVIPTPNLKP